MTRDVIDSASDSPANITASHSTAVLRHLVHWVLAGSISLMFDNSIQPLGDQLKPL